MGFLYIFALFLGNCILELMTKVMVDFDTAFPVISVFVIHGVFDSSF